MIVMKFGGSSLKDPASIYHAAEIIKTSKIKENKNGKKLRRDQ